MDETPLAGRYRRVRSLGSGGAGEVWLAEDLVLDRLVAVKYIHSAILPTPVDLQRMKREATLTARLNHPNAVAIFDLVVEDGLPHVVMEYVDGQSLADRIHSAGGLPPADVAGLIAGVADALAEAHAMGVIHRDIKPANILITKRGVAKLADFGIAKIAGEPGGTVVGDFMGTPAYMAPEVAKGGSAGPPSDVWALGITVWAALQGHPPAHLRDDDTPYTVLARVLHGTVSPPSRGGPLTRPVMRLLHLDAVERPSAQEAAALMRAAQRVEPDDDRPTRFVPPLNDGAWGSAARWDPDRFAARDPFDAPSYHASRGDTGRSESSPPPPAPHFSRRRRRRAPLLIILLALLAVAALVAGVFVWRARRQSDDIAATHPPSSVTTTASTSNVASSSASAGPTSTATSPSPTISARAFTTYHPPGGFTVDGPELWTITSTASGNTALIDLTQPDTTREANGGFRLGIGSRKASTDIAAALRIAQSNASKTFSAVVPLKTVTGTFFGHSSYYFEYLGTDDARRRRHLGERVWISRGEELVIDISAPDENRWNELQPAYQQMLDTCMGA